MRKNRSKKSRETFPLTAFALPRARSLFDCGFFPACALEKLKTSSVPSTVFAKSRTLHSGKQGNSANSMLRTWKVESLEEKYGGFDIVNVYFQNKKNTLRDSIKRLFFYFIHYFKGLLPKGDCAKGLIFLS